VLKRVLWVAKWLVSKSKITNYSTTAVPAAVCYERTQNTRYINYLTMQEEFSIIRWEVLNKYI